MRLNRLIPFAFWSWFAIWSNAAYGDVGEISFACEASSSWVRIGDESPEIATTNVKASVGRINWLSLLKTDRSKRVNDEPLPIGSRVSVRRCGRFTLQFTAGFLLPTTGDAPFPVIEVYVGQTRIVGPIALTSCTEEVMKYDYFGHCPESWAESIVAEWDNKLSKARITAVRTFEDESFNPARRVDRYVAP